MDLTSDWDCKKQGLKPLVPPIHAKVLCECVGFVSQLSFHINLMDVSECTFETICFNYRKRNGALLIY